MTQNDGKSASKKLNLGIGASATKSQNSFQTNQVGNTFQPGNAGFNQFSTPGQGQLNFGLNTNQ